MKRVDERSIRLTEVISAAVVLATGLFLVLCGAEVIGLDIRDCWLMSVYVCLFLIFLTVAVVQKNAIGACLMCIFAMLMLAEAFVLFGYAHREIYPIYVAAVPLGLLCAAFMRKGARAIVPLCVAAVGGAAILATESSGLLPLSVALPIVAIYFGVLGIVYACHKLIKARTETQKNTLDKEG